MTTKKLFRKLHLWLSVPFGLIIAAICFSGAMMVFENEIMEWTHHDLYYVEKAEGRTLPVEQLVETVAATLPADVEVTGVTIPAQPDRTWQVNLSKPHRAAVYIDPYTGRITGKTERTAFFTTMMRLHRCLLGEMRHDGTFSPGKLLIGIGVLAFVIILISGVVIWWPATRKALKTRLTINTRKGWHRFWYDLHVAGGIYAFIFLLAMALTGLNWSFGWYRTGFYKLWGVDAQPRTMQATGASEGGNAHERHGRGHAGAAGEGRHAHADGEGRHAHAGHHRHSPYARWQDVYETLAESNPQFKQITVGNGEAEVALGNLGNRRAADKYTFNPRNGELTGHTDYRTLPASGKIHGWIFSVHTGCWGGVVTRVLALLATLLGTTLPLTGYYLWIRRLCRKKQAPAKKAPVR